MKQNFLKGAIIISVGGIAAKILGAFYRIPLTNILGGEGMGVYQMVYPLYCLLLTVSATGIPSGLARIVSSAESRGDHAKSRAVLFKSLLLFSGVGLCGSALMFLLAPVMSAAQGEIGAVAAYRALAPGVFFVSVLSCLRGWFQGKSNFFHTAFSEICEQAVKVALRLFFARAFRGEPFKAVAWTLASVTFSEFAACLLLAFLAWGERTKRPLFRERVQDLRAKQLLRVTIPVTVAAGLLPLSNLLDSILIVRLVGRYASNATALYGLYAGAAATLVNLPVSVCYGIAAAIIPAVSACQSKGLLREAEERTLFALKCTLFLSLPAAAFLLAFPSGVTSFLFSSVTGAEGETLASLVRALALTAVFLSCVQTLAACLTGRGKPKIAAFAMTAAVAFKLVAEFVLLQFPQISVLGAAYAAIGCYFVALAADLLYSIRERKNRIAVLAYFFKFSAMSAAAVFCAAAAARVHVLLALCAAVLIYLALAVLLRAFSAQELQFTRRNHHAHHRRAGMQS